MVEYGGGCGALCEGQPEEEVPLASERALALLKVNKTIGTAKKNQQIIIRYSNQKNQHFCQTKN